MEIDRSHMASSNDEPQRKLQIKMMESTILDSFAKLVSENDRERIDGGLILLKHLSQSQQDNEQYVNELNYALKRLIRGTGSTRISARKGFYSTLVGLLATQNVSVGDVFQMVQKELHTTGNNSKGEKADIYGGQLLVAGALIKSKLYERADHEEKGKIIQQILNAGKQRNFLALGTYTFLTSLLENLDEAEFKSIIWPLIQGELKKSWPEQTLDTIWFLSLLSEKYPTIVKQKFFSTHLEAPQLIHVDTIKYITDKLVNTPMLKTIKHPIYPYISKKIANSECLDEFCQELNKQLERPTRNKQIIVTTILIHLIEHLDDANQIPNILIPKLIQEILKTIVYIKKKKNDDVYLKTNEFFTALTTKLTQENVKPKIKIKVLKQLIFYPGNFLFEKKTGCKIIQQIINTLDRDSVVKISKIYKNVLSAESEKEIGNEMTEPWLNTERIYAAHMLNKLLGLTVMQTEYEWRLETVIFLVDLTLFQHKTCKIGVELAAQLKECLYRSFHQKLASLEELRKLLTAIVTHIEQIISSPNGNENLRNPLSSESIAQWQDMLKLLKEIEKKKTSSKQVNYSIPVFHTLVLHMGLELFSDSKLAESSLKELRSCFERVESKRKKSTENDSNEPLWVEVIIDLFLSLLSQTTHVHRNIIGCVFPYLCPHLNETAILQILSVLDTKNENNPLLDYDSDESDVDSVNDESIEEEEEKLTETDNEESDVEESDIEEEENDPVNEKFRMAVREALATSGTQSDDESVNLDDMDDEEGKRLDQALSAAFKSFKNSIKKPSKKGKQNKTDKALTHFRVRVLDLIDIYLDSEPAMEITLKIMLPLLQSLEFSIRDVHQKPLENRLRSCLKKLSNLKKFSSTNNITSKTLSELLKSLLEKGSTSTLVFQDMGDKITACCVFIIRCSLLINEKKSKKVNESISEIIKNSLITFFQKRDNFLPIILFTSILQMTWDGNWILAPLLVQFAFDSKVRPFRRNQALELLIVLFKNHRLFDAKAANYRQDLETSLSTNLNDLFENLIGDPDKRMKDKFICRVMNLLHAVKHLQDQMSWDSFMDWEKLGSLIQTYRATVPLGKESKKAYNKLCNLLNLTNTVVTVKANQNGNERQEKPKEDNSENGSIDNDKKRIDKKRKKHKSMAKDKQQLKKEAKLLRTQAMSQGLDTFSFAQVPDVHLLNGDHNVDEEQPRKRKSLTSENNDTSTSAKKKKRNKEIVNNC